MKYLIELIYRKCWDDLEIRRYVRMHLFDHDLDAEKLLNILNDLAAKCLGEVDELPPPP